MGPRVGRRLIRPLARRKVRSAQRESAGSTGKCEGGVLRRSFVLRGDFVFLLAMRLLLLPAAAEVFDEDAGGKNYVHGRVGLFFFREIVGGNLVGDLLFGNGRVVNNKSICSSICLNILYSVSLDIRCYAVLSSPRESHIQEDCSTTRKLLPQRFRINASITEGTEGKIKKFRVRTVRILFIRVCEMTSE